MDGTEPEPVKFSIVIPTYNRRDRLETCLNSIADINYDKDRFEVIVIDDGGVQNLQTLIDGLQNRFQIVLLTQENTGPATARNNGVKIAKGEYIAFTDDDCTVAPDWLMALDRWFDKDPDCAVAGIALNGLEENVFSTASQLLIDYLCEYYNSKDAEHSFGTSNNLAFPRKLLLEIGGFDQSFPLSAAEDRELIDRWCFNNHPMIYAKDIIVTHFHKMNLKTYSQQHLNYGRGAHRYHIVRALRGSGTVDVEPPRFYFDLLTYPLRQGIGFGKAFILSFLMFWSQFVGTIGYAYQGFRSRSR